MGLPLDVGVEALYGSTVSPRFSRLNFQSLTPIGL